ncbi:uncharacterized protein LOC134767198 isoform X1 [Penaeus indicus]|uniref:uncharacterized protein LOC134767198 isoform X1 n=1 Tax=Penaeus indicus TaxID=29960 RepID=UPI00300C294E
MFFDIVSAFRSRRMMMFVMTTLVIPSLTLSDDPCTVQEIEVNKDPVMKTYVNYTFVGPTNCSSLRCNGPISTVSVISCQDTGRQLYSFSIQKNKRSGLKCVKNRGCVRLKCGSISSDPVHVEGIVRNISISNPFFRSSKTLEMNFASYEQVKDWNIVVKDEAGKLLALKVTRGTADQHVIHSNYVLGKTYTLLVFPVLKKPDSDCKIRFTKKIIFSETTNTHKGEKPAGPNQLKISLAIVFLLVVVAISCLVWRRNTRIQRRPDFNAQVELLPSMDVLLVHTNESSELRDRIGNLTKTLQENRKKVSDIYSDGDCRMRHDPQAWLFSKMHSEVWLVLVFTRALGELYAYLAANPDFVEPHKILHRPPHAYDGNLVTVLKFLLDQQDESRWLTVRFDDLEAEEAFVDCGPHVLIGARVFGIPTHEKDLLQTLNA